MSSSTDNQAAAVKDSNEIPPTTLSNENSSATTAQDTEDFDLDLSEEEFQSADITSHHGLLYNNNLDFEGAVELYTRAIDNCPVDRNEVAAFYNNRAACYFHLENFNACVDDCSKAISLDPPYVKACLRRAQAQEKLEKLEDALKDYEEVLKHDRSNKTARDAAYRLPSQIKEQQEKMKEEMFSNFCIPKSMVAKLKDLGNMCLKPFGLSTDNFQMQFFIQVQNEKGEREGTINYASKSNINGQHGDIARLL
eukprot:gene2063-5122_t